MMTQSPLPRQTISLVGVNFPESTCPSLHVSGVDVLDIPFAVVQLADLGLVDVEAHDAEVRICKSGNQRQPNVAGR